MSSSSSIRVRLLLPLVVLLNVLSSSSSLSLFLTPNNFNLERHWQSSVTTFGGLVSSALHASTNNDDPEVLDDEEDEESIALPQDPSSQLKRYRCRVAYDGTAFLGFQIQPSGKRTVQGVLEDVLERRFQRHIRVVGASRTDTGVHARGQAIHFDLTRQEHESILQQQQQHARGGESNSNKQSSLLETSMNRMLPMDVRIWNVGPAPPPTSEIINGTPKILVWNVMRKCSGKLYCYRLCLGDAMDPIERHTRWQLDSGWIKTLVVTRLSEILQSYQGTHDFVCFAGALEANARKTGKTMLSTVRTVQSCQLICEDLERGYYKIDIYLEGALYKMVRNMVGTAVDVARGALDRATFDQLLQEPGQRELSRDDNRCKPAPPQGLTLERVFYPNDDF